MPDRSAFWGLALITGATIMLQVVLTRIFSVVMWYHMSLVAVSMAMFGMTVGSLIVHRRPAAFTPQRAWEGLRRGTALYFALAIAARPARLPEHANAKCRPDLHRPDAGLPYWTGVAALPFVFSGVCVCVALTRFPSGRRPALRGRSRRGRGRLPVLVVYLLDHLDAAERRASPTAALAVHRRGALCTLPIARRRPRRGGGR
jgi:hypothetical protein